MISEWYYVSEWVREDFFVKIKLWSLLSELDVLKALTEFGSI